MSDIFAKIQIEVDHNDSFNIQFNTDGNGASDYSIVSSENRTIAIFNFHRQDMASIHSAIKSNLQQMKFCSSDPGCRSDFNNLLSVAEEKALSSEAFYSKNYSRFRNNFVMSIAIMQLK